MTAKASGGAGTDLSIEISHPTPKSKSDDSEEGDGDDESFTIIVKRGGAVAETFEGLTARKGPRNAVDVVTAESQLIELQEVGRTSVADRRPAAGRVDLAGGGSGGVPATVTPDDYVGNSADRTGFAGLEAVDEVTMLSVPDLMSVYEQGHHRPRGLQAVQLAMIAHCELMGDRRRHPRRAAGPQRPAGQGVARRQGRLRLQVRDAVLAVDQGLRPAVRQQRSSSRRRGHMAGIWARNDATRGVHKAPANEVVRGAIDLGSTSPRSSTTS